MTAARRGKRHNDAAAETAVDRVCNVVREGILQGRWTAGEHLRETALAQETGFSRTPVREALQKLAASGLVEYLPNHGARVVSWSRQSIDEIYELRMKLEVYAAEQAARRMSTGDTDIMERLCDEMEQSFASAGRDHLNIISKANRDFHDIIVRAADAGRLAITLRGLVEVPLVMRTYHHYAREDMVRSFGHHRELVAALRARQSEWAGSVMTSHIIAARVVLLRN